MMPTSLSIESSICGLLGDIDGVRNLALLIGLGTLAGGILLLIQHKRELDRVLASDQPERIQRFERRKYRRRATSSSLIASVGCLLAGFYWVTDRPVFSVFILLILGLLAGIVVLAMIDFFSVGLHQLATPDEKTERALLEEIIQRHRDSKENLEDVDG